jgi:hypothetical protein
VPKRARSERLSGHQIGRRHLATTNIVDLHRRQRGVRPLNQDRRQPVLHQALRLLIVKHQRNDQQAVEPPRDRQAVQVAPYMFRRIDIVHDQLKAAVEQGAGHSA